MKKIISLSCISLFSVTVVAQSSFFLQPVAGIGATNVSYVDYTGHTTSDDYAINFDGGLLAGLYAGKWVFNSGLVYLRTGSKASITLVDALGNPIGTSHVHYRFSHLVLPLEAGRVFALGEKLSLTPSAGVGLSYNISANDKNGIDHRVGNIPGGTYNSYHNALGCYGILQAEFAWSINSNFDLTCAPTYNYMLTKMFLPHQDPNTVWQHDYTLLLNVGVKWHFAKKEKHADNNAVQHAK